MQAPIAVDSGKCSANTDDNEWNGNNCMSDDDPK